MSFERIVFGAALMVVLVGCASMIEAQRKQVCNYDGAYKQGMNDARENQPMNTSISSYCDATETEVTERGYREGYTAGVGNRPTQIFVNVSGRKSGSHGPGSSCLERYGKKTCGYGCVDAYGEVRCARISGNACMEAYGAIHCGRNCRMQYGEVTCDMEE